MLIRVGFDLEFEFPAPTEALLCLLLHPSRMPSLVEPEKFSIEPSIPIYSYSDAFGNRCARIAAPAGLLRLLGDAVVEDDGQPDRIVPWAEQHPIVQLPADTLPYLLASRYCEVDSELAEVAWSHFAEVVPGWNRVQAICDFVHAHLKFDYLRARATRTALEAYKEGVGVCRDFTHLAITLCRCMNIPARYATGYLGDICVPAVPFPMDFSAWFQVFIGGEWHTFDARHNVPRVGRVLMATGRDAADVALLTTFGANQLAKFTVWTDEVASLSGEGASMAGFQRGESFM